MPTVPSNPKCASLGCRNSRTKYSTMCEQHGGRTTPYRFNNRSNQRYSTDKMYQTAQWASFRQTHLSRNPLCAACLLQGKYVQASDIDHVFPWKQLSKEAFYINLFQSLCKPCHSKKTSWERAGYFKHFTSTQENTYTLQDYEGLTTFLR